MQGKERSDTTLKVTFINTEFLGFKQQMTTITQLHSFRLSHVCEKIMGVQPHGCYISALIPRTF